MTTYKTFDTERLILKPTDIDDAEFIIEIYNTPKWIRFIGERNVKTKENAVEYIEKKILPQLKRLGYSNYTLLLKANHQKIGICGLFDREGLEGIDIGFAFLPEFEKKGYGFESASKLMTIAFDEFGINEINAITDKDNISSQKLLEKLGLELTGTTKLSAEDEEVLLYKAKLNANKI